ncbi:plasmid mobilization protein [Ruminococcus flavefaciens]
MIRLRVTEDEVKRFKEKATEAGCRTISQYIRLRCFDDNTFDNAHKKAAE